jgi:hypothetical protein
MLGFFSSRPNWDSHTPSAVGECVPPFVVGGGEGYTLPCGRAGGGVPIPTRVRDRHCGTLGYMYLYDLDPKDSHVVNAPSTCPHRGF